MSPWYSLIECTIRSGLRCRKHGGEVLGLGHAGVEVGEGGGRQDERVGGGPDAEKPLIVSLPKPALKLKVSAAGVARLNRLVSVIAKLERAGSADREAFGRSAAA